MEVTKEEPGTEPELCMLSDNEDTIGVLTHKEEKSDEKEVGKCKNLKEQEKQSQKRIINLQRDLTAIVADVQTAADATVVQKRTQLNKAKEFRAALLENDVKSSQKQLYEIEMGWSLVKQKVILPDLQEALNKQQELCAVLIQDKKKLINELQQELKLGDDCYVKDLRKNAEEIDLMIKRMEEQMNILTQAYREELAQIERVHQQELKFLLLEDTTKWEEDLKEMLDKELERLSERRNKVEEYEEKIHQLRLKNAHIAETLGLESIANVQNQQRENQKIKNAVVLEKLKRLHRQDEEKQSNLSLANLKRIMLSYEIEMRNLNQLHMNEQQEFTKQSRVLSADQKRQVQKYESLKGQIKHFAVADGRKFEEMRLMIDADLKQLAERAVLIDSVICKQLLGLPWEQPPSALLERSGPSRSPERAGSSDSRPEGGKEYFFTETQKKVKEMLCHETDFLIETNVLKLLAPLENEEQTDMKLVTLLYSLGLSNKDLPELTNFILKYEQQQREQNKDAGAESSDLAEAAASGSTTNSASELIDPNHVLPALKSFLKHKRGSSAHHDSSENEAYWENLGNIVPEEKLKLWDAAERKLKEYHSVLTEISDLTLETDRLKQRNSELRMQLKQRLTSTVD